MHKDDDITDMPHVEKAHRDFENMIGIKLAYYRKEDWKRFIKIIDDLESIHDTWNDWHKAFLNTKRDLISQGFEVTDIEIDLNELINYCEMKGIKNDGKARSQFVQAK